MLTDQYSQESVMDSSESLEDILTTRSNNSSLSSVQITNIGKGLLAQSPFSSISGAVNINEGFDRINQSIKIIFNTCLEEVPMLPILGSRVDNLLFEQIDEVLEDSLEVTIKEALGKLEPRVKIRDLVIDTSRRDENIIGVMFEYQLTNTNIVHRFRTQIITGNGGDTI